MTMGKYEVFDPDNSGITYIRAPGLNQDVRELMFYMRRAVYGNR